MFPGNINKRQMEQAMKRMGVQQQDIAAEEVIIRTAEKDIIIQNPSVARVKMMGQESFQISGQIVEKPRSSMPEINEADIDTIVEQTGCSRQEAVDAATQANGDLAEAILILKGDTEE